MWRKNRSEGINEDAIAFGSRLKFVEIETPESVIPWPCLQFENLQTLQVLLIQKQILTCHHMKHRITTELLQHLHHGGCPDDPVVFLFGNRTPGGHRLRFTSQTYDYKESIVAAVDEMGTEPRFMDALNETSPILAVMLAEEQLRQLLPGPGQHAPAA